MKKILKANAITRFFSLFIAIVLLCFAAFFLVFSEGKEACLGTIAPNAEYNQVYQSEPFSFSLEDYEVFLPQGGIISTIPLSDTFTGLLFLGEGEAVHRESCEKISGGYLVVDAETYLRLKGDTLFLPLEDRHLKRKFAATARQLFHNPAIHSLGFERIFLPPAGRSHLYLEYNGAPLVHPAFSNVYSGLLPRLMLYFSLVIAIILLIARVLTLDLKPSYSLAAFLKTPPVLAEKYLCLSVFILLFLMHRFWPASQPSNPFRGEISTTFLVFYLALFLLVQGLAYRGKIPPQYSGFQWRHFPRDTALALVISLAITVLSTLQIPSDLSGSINTRQLLLQFIYFFSWAAVFELAWRNFLQTIMERLWGKRAGLFINTLLFTGIFFVSTYGNLAEQNTNILLLCELLFFVPGTALILGYIYQKTRSVLGNTLILTLLLFLPRLLNF